MSIMASSMATVTKRSLENMTGPRTTTRIMEHDGEFWQT